MIRFSDVTVGRRAARAVCAAATLFCLATIPASAEDAPGTGLDPVRLRAEMLRRMDAAIDARAARDHLEARLLLDATLPIAYLGLDADPVEGGMKITKVYPDSGAQAAGLREADIVRAIGGMKTDGKVAFGRSIRRFRPGDVIEVALTRDGKDVTLKATLGNRPEEDEDEDEQYPELANSAAAPAPIALDFEKDAAGAIPAMLEGALGGHGRAPHWSVVKDDTGARLRQDDADPTGIRFPMALVRDFAARDVAASVRFRFAGGKQDRAVGVVLRYQDPGNYLVARCNAVETDVRIFRVANGVRKTLPDGIVKVPVDERDDKWHVLTFRAEGPKLMASFDGKESVTAYDTYFGRGRVGLWTKSDAVTDFDDVRFEALPKAEVK